MRKVLPPTYFLTAIVLACAFHFLLPVRQLVVFPWNLAGLVPLVMGIALNLMADKSFKVSGTTVKPFEESSALITGGVFRLSRNPMYLGMSLILLGIALLFGSATPLLVVPVFALLVDRVFIVPEQRMLEATFGEQFQEYRRRVRRWV